MNGGGFDMEKENEKIPHLRLKFIGIDYHSLGKREDMQL